MLVDLTSIPLLVLSLNKVGHGDLKTARDNVEFVNRDIFPTQLQIVQVAPADSYFLGERLYCERLLGSYLSYAFSHNLMG